jgi:hypothetical protein
MRSDKETTELIPRLRGAFSYDPESGILSYASPRQKVRVGDRAGRQQPQGHRVVGFAGRTFVEHRVIFAIQTGRWPIAEIDHINNRRADNRWANLREATRTQNQRNNPGYTRKHGARLKGAYPVGSSGKWQAIISVGGKATYIGTFETEENAHDAYVLAAEGLVGEFARGRPSWLD